MQVCSFVIDQSTNFFVLEVFVCNSSFAFFCSLSNLEFPLEILSSIQLIMSWNTISMFSVNSPYVRECHISGYNLNILAKLEAVSYRSLLTVGSVTLSASPCPTKNGNLTSWSLFSRSKLTFSSWLAVCKRSRPL
ncbi:hypothetical protein HanXRQr2_Chr05g0214161 [Helianthus annuus]|uniref:Uncharacterized protein n=1 Tax=Helianthus annuus TaxID=4232 RepID=A0A9K3IZ64_HELAN|nr:hypothetical protein HanXRQr2_Chr05g0214161 [Helianthus annuus]